MKILVTDINYRYICVCSDLTDAQEMYHDSSKYIIWNQNTDPIPEELKNHKEDDSAYVIVESYYHKDYAVNKNPTYTGHGRLTIDEVHKLTSQFGNLKGEQSPYRITLLNTTKDGYDKALTTLQDRNFDMDDHRLKFITRYLNGFGLEFNNDREYLTINDILEITKEGE